MTSTKTTIPFTGTAEQKAALDKVIADHKGLPGALMPVMQQAQEIYGYLPIEVQTMIAAFPPSTPGSTWSPRASIRSGSAWAPPAT